MVCSLAAAALVAAVPAFAQQPYGAGARPRPVSTFATPYPTLPTPGPVRPYVERQEAPFPVANVRPQFEAQQSFVDSSLTQAGYRQVSAAQPSGAARPGAAGKVMYFHKSENSLTPDGMADPGAIAMATRADVPAFVLGVPDLPVPRPGVMPPTPPPATVVERPIVGPTIELVIPPQPFNPVPVLPTLPTVAQPAPKDEPPAPAGKDPLPTYPTQLPPRSVIMMMYNDDVLEREIYKSVAKQNNQNPEDLKKRYPFPTLKPTVPPGTVYTTKTVQLPPAKVEFEAGFVIHHRLHFEEKNSERYGWDLGFITPFVSTVAFYKNVLLWPSSLASSLVVGTVDTNVGKCLPGSPTPYYLYPQGLTITGGVAEGLVITGLSFVIP